MGKGSGIRNPEKTYSGSRIQGSKRHRIPDPESGSATLISIIKDFLKDTHLQMLHNAEVPSLHCHDAVHLTHDPVKPTDEKNH
jgi:hypothetical protein